MAAESVRNGARSGEPAESQNEDFTSRGSTSNGAHEKKYTHAAVEGTANGDVDHSKGIPVAINTHASAVGDSQADAQKNIDSATTNQKDNDTQVNTSTDTHSDGPVDTTTESPSGAHADVQAELDTNNSESPEITIGNESDKRVCELHSNADDQEQPEVLIIRSISDLDTGTHETVKLTDTSQDEGTEDIGSHAGHAEADANIGNHRNDFSAGKVVIVRKRSNLHAGSHHTHTGGHHHHKSSRHTNTNHTQPNAKGKDKAEGDAGQTATGAEAKEDNSKELAGGNNEGVPISRTLHNSADREPELQRVESQQSHGGEIGNLLKVQTSTGQLSGPSSDVSMQRSFSLRKVMHDSHKEKLGHRKTDNNTGKVTYKKTNSQELMDCIQLGLRYSISSVSSRETDDVLMQDFVETITVDFLREGSTLTPAHSNSPFTFTTYAPRAFRYFRDVFGILPEHFLLSLCSDPLKELSNPGASGSLFYLSQDDNFIIKTVQKKEAAFLRDLLPGYFLNVTQNTRTLLPKFFGLFNFRSKFGKNIRILVMNNILPTNFVYHERYDLKGSTWARVASPKERKKRSPTLKDLDFISLHSTGILLSEETYNAFARTLRRDVRVLTSFGIMDYSLLVGVHFLSDNSARALHQSTDMSDAQPKLRARTPTIPEAEAEDIDEDHTDGSTHTHTHTHIDTSHDTSSHTTEHEHRRIVTNQDSEKGRGGAKVGADGDAGHTEMSHDEHIGPTSTTGNAAAALPHQQSTVRAHKYKFSSMAETLSMHQANEGDLGEGLLGFTSTGKPLLLFIGVIDVLQNYAIAKKLEHTFKAVMYNSKTVSVCNPDYYECRYLQFCLDFAFRPMTVEQLRGMAREFSRSDATSIYRMNRLQQLVEMQDEALAVSSTHSDDYTPANTLTNEEKQLQSAEEASGRSANVRTPHVDFADLARDREDARLDAEAERKGKEPAIVRPDTGMQSDESSVSPVPRDVSASGDSDYSAGEMADRSSPVVANGSTSPTADHQNNTPHAQSMGVEQDTTKPNSRELPNIRVDLISGDDISLDALSEGVTRLPSSVPGAGTNQSASNSKSKGARTNQKAPNTNRGKHIRARSTTGGFTDSLPSLSEGRRRGRANSYSPVQQLSVSLALTAATPNDEPEERKKAKTSSDALPSSADAIKSRLGTGGNLKIDTSFRKRSQSYGSNMNALAGGNGGVSTQDEGNQVQHTNSMSPLYNSAKKFDNRRASSVSGTLNHNDKSLNNTFSFSNDHRASMSQSQPGNTNSSTSTTLQRQDSLEKFLSVKRLSQIGSQYGFAASRSPSPPLSSDANKLGGTKSQPSIYRNRAPVSESPTSTRNRSGNMLRATRIYSSQDALQTFSTNSSNARSRARSTTASFMGSASIPTNIASDGVSSHATNESASSSEGKGLERSSSTDYDSDRHYGSAISAISDADRRLQSDTNPETASPTEIKVNSLVDSQASQEHNASDPTSETALPGSPTSSDAPQVCSGVDADVRPREDRTVLGSSSTNSTNSTANQANRSSIRQNMRLPPKLSIVPPSDPLIVADEDG